MTISKPTKSQLKKILTSTAKSDGEWNFAAAGRALGVTQRSTVRNWASQYGLSRPTPKVTETSLAVATETARLRQDNKGLKRQLSELMQTKLGDEEMFSLVSKLHKANLKPPKWVSPRRRKGPERAMAVTMFSDWHLDEVVEPAQIDWVNGYNRKIAAKRMQNYFENLIRLSRDYINGIQIEGLVVNMLGDMVSGNIHEELQQTNESTIIETCIYWPEKIVAGFRMLLEHFPKIFVTCISGNHGRLTRKPRAKFRAQDNFDFLIHHMVAKALEDTDIEFAISPAADYRYKIYDDRMVATHGDQFRGGSGISGAMAPLLLGNARKSMREAAKERPYKYLMMGHWHQLRQWGPVLINGSGKGHDEYAEVSNFGLEKPEQAFWLQDPEHGKTIWAPIHVLDKNEPWQEESNAQLS